MGIVVRYLGDGWGWTQIDERSDRQTSIPITLPHYTSNGARGVPNQVYKCALISDSQAQAVLF